MVSSCPLVSKSSSSFTSPLGIIPIAPITIHTTVTFIIIIIVVVVVVVVITTVIAKTKTKKVGKRRRRRTLQAPFRFDGKLIRDRYERSANQNRCSMLFYFVFLFFFFFNVLVSDWLINDTDEMFCSSFIRSTFSFSFSFSPSITAFISFSLLFFLQRWQQIKNIK